MKHKAKFRAIANLLGIFLCLVLIYIFVGSPVLSVEAAYRRAETANLVGPGEILAILEPEGQEYSHLVLARDDTGAMVCAWDWTDPDLREFTYQAGSLVLAAAPGRELYWLRSHAILPVYLFDQSPEAVRAELTLTIQSEYQGEACEAAYSLSADRENAGYFAFTIRSDTCLGPEGHCLSQLRNVTGNSSADLSKTRIEAVVRLYDSRGTLLARETILF